MRQRTTITLNKDYLDNLKTLAWHRGSNVSDLINEAVGRLINSQSVRENLAVKDFFADLEKAKKSRRFSRREIRNFVEDGRK